MKNYLNYESESKTTKSITFKLILFIFCIFLFTGVVAGEEELDSGKFGKEFSHAVNMCPQGVIFGILPFNYEHLFDQTHGVVARLDYETFSNIYDNPTVKPKRI